MFLRLASATLLICVGCGGNDVHHLPDAPPGGDGMVAIDAAPDAPAHGFASVTVFSTQTPGTVAVGIPAVFINPDGTLVASVVTDANGEAAADVMPGASVTVVEVLAARTQMQTVLAIQPGDHITLGVAAATVNVGTFTVNFPTIVTAGPPNNYQVVGPCGSVSSTTSPITMAIANNCKLDTMEMVVIETNAAGQVIGFLDKPGVPFVDAGSTTITGTYAPLMTFNASYTNIPSLVTTINLARDVPDGFGVANSTNMAVTGTTLALSVPAAATGTAMIVDRFSDAARSTQLLEQNIAGNLNADIVDVGGSLLPWLGAVTLDVTTGNITVPVDPTGTTGDAPDLALTEVSYTRPGALAPTNFGWLVFGATPGNLTLPALPAAVGGVNPQAGDTAGTCLGFSIESDAFAGYDAVRAIPYTVLGQAQSKRFAGARLRLSQSSTPG